MEYRPKTQAMGGKTLQQWKGEIERKSREAGISPYVANALVTYCFDHADASGEPMSQKRLAEYMEEQRHPVSLSRLKAYIGMKDFPKDSTIQELSDSLGVSFDVLKFGVENDYRDTQEKTGLTPAAINNLHGLKYHGEDYPNNDLVSAAINALLGDSRFIEELGFALPALVDAYECVATDWDAQVIGVEKDRRVRMAKAVVARVFEDAAAEFAIMHSNYNKKAKEYQRKLREEGTDHAQESSEQ